MYSKIILNILMIISLVAIQIAFISGLPAWFKNLNLIIIVLIFILGLGNIKLAIWWAIGVGLLYDIYSFQPFGIYLFSFLITVLLSHFLLSNFFTNRSLYSFLALIFFAGLGYKLVLYFLSNLASLFERRGFLLNIDSNFWISELSHILLNLSAVFILFNILSFVSNMLKPMFLFKRK